MNIQELNSLESVQRFVAKNDKKSEEYLRYLLTELRNSYYDLGFDYYQFLEIVLFMLISIDHFGLRGNKIYKIAEFCSFDKDKFLTIMNSLEHHLLTINSLEIAMDYPELINFQELHKEVVNRVMNKMFSEDCRLIALKTSIILQKIISSPKPCT